MTEPEQKLTLKQAKQLACDFYFECYIDKTCGYQHVVGEFDKWVDENPYYRAVRLMAIEDNGSTDDAQIENIAEALWKKWSMGEEGANAGYPQMPKDIFTLAIGDCYKAALSQSEKIVSIQDEKPTKTEISLDDIEVYVHAKPGEDAEFAYVNLDDDKDVLRLKKVKLSELINQTK